jgi:ABC-type uncharacterized transport system auxiliary subunit
VKPASITTIILTASVLVACSGLTSKAQPDQTYVLHAAPSSAGAAGVQGVLAVLRPEVQPGLDTDRIMLTRAGQELDHFAASRWGESLSKVVGALVVESLAGSGGFTNVVDSGRAAVTNDYELLLTVRHFEAAYDGSGAAPVAHVVFECALTAGTPRRIIGRCDAAADEPAAANRISAIVAALESAAQRALADVRTAAVAAARTR